ncbi:MAG: hypothetical protein HY551_07735 [Elusimicrobia bacterium]|nr:hypothetical protein [Elusimicrobiota bacterium]
MSGSAPIAKSGFWGWLRRPRSLWAGATLVGAAFAVVGLLVLDALRRPRTVMLALDPLEAERTAGASEYPIEDLWERARTIGVSAVYLEPQRLSSWIARGEVLHLSKTESEKWAAAGLVSPGSPLRSNALWVRDRELFEHLLLASRAWGFGISTQSFGGVYVLNLPDGVEPGSLPLGYDPAAMRSARRMGLTPVIGAAAPAEMQLLLMMASPKVSVSGPAVFWLGPAFQFPAAPGGKYAPGTAGKEVQPLPAASEQAVLEAVALRGRTALAFSPPQGWRGYGSWGAWEGTALSAAHVRVREGLAPLWRRVLGGGARLVVAHLAPELGVERNLDGLRATATALRGRGMSLELNPGPGRLRGPASWIGAFLRYGVAAVLAVFGVLVSIRRGLQFLRKEALARRWPEADPIPEIAGALAATVLGSIIAASAAYALLAFELWRLGLIGVPWAVWTTLLPFALGLLALYGDEMKEWPARWLRPVTYRGLATLLFLLCFSCFLVFPRAVLQRFGLASLLDWQRSLPEPLWWLGLRWREVLVGYPCLTIGLWLQLRNIRDRMDKADSLGQAEPKSSARDPRFWLFLGLFAPTGIVRIFGYARIPYHTLVWQTLLGLVLGGGLALAGIWAWEMFRDLRGQRA